MIELDDLKRIWKEGNMIQPPNYSIEEIDQFRKSRSRDFSKWIRSSLAIDFAIKSLIGITFIVLFFLFSDQIVERIVCLALAGLTFLLILIERPHYQKSIELDRTTEALQDALEAKLRFLKSYYFKIQFMVGLTNPLLVTAGSFIYYLSKYGKIPKMDFVDILVFAAILIVSFLFTIPTTAGLYGFHLKTLRNSLANLENKDHWNKEMKRYNKSKKTLTVAFLSLLIIGIITLVLILIRYKTQQ